MKRSNGHSDDRGKGVIAFNSQITTKTHNYTNIDTNQYNYNFVAVFSLFPPLSLAFSFNQLLLTHFLPDFYAFFLENNEIIGKKVMHTFSNIINPFLTLC